MKAYEKIATKEKVAEAGSKGLSKAKSSLHMSAT